MEIAVPRSTVAILVLLAVCVFVPPIQATKISYCNRKADYAVKVTDVVISPDPIKKGKPTTFEIHAFTAQPLAGGNMNLDVSYFGVHVHSESDDVCEKSSCPIQPGNFVLSHTQTLPGITPPMPKWIHTARKRVLLKLRHLVVEPWGEGELFHHFHDRVVTTCEVLAEENWYVILEHPIVMADAMLKALPRMRMFAGIQAKYPYLVHPRTVKPNIREYKYHGEYTVNPDSIMRELMTIHDDWHRFDEVVAENDGVETDSEDYN